jgi:hypothetical protein
MGAQKNKRISGGTKIIMLVFAFFLDLIELILAALIAGIFINRLITIFEYFIYWFWFKIKGVSFSSNAKMGRRFGGTAILEMIPVVGALPGFTLGVYMTIKEVEKEDKENYQKTKAAEINSNITRVRRG